MIQLLAQDGWRLKFKDLLEANYEDKGFRDSSRYFEKIQDQEQGVNPLGGPGQNMQVPGVPGAPQANPNQRPNQQVAGSRPVGQAGKANIPQPKGVPQGVR